MKITYLISVIAGGGNWDKPATDKEQAIAEAKRLAKLPENLGVHVYEVSHEPDGDFIGRMVGNFYQGNF